MSLNYGEGHVMHRIRVKLYPNYLPGYENTYIARTDNEASLSIEDVCAALRDRGRFNGDYNTLVDHVKKYYDETAYQLCNGFSINNGYYSLYPNLGGVFNGPMDTPDPKKHILSFRFRILQGLRKTAESIGISIEGIATTDAYIHEFIDTDENSRNNFFKPGHLFALRGRLIKIEGDDPSVGMYFVPIDGSSPVKVSRLNENSSTNIRGVIPETENQVCKIEIRTQFSGSSLKPLKNVRIIKSSFTLTNQ